MLIIHHKFKITTWAVEKSENDWRRKIVNKRCLKTRATMTNNIDAKYRTYEMNEERDERDITESHLQIHHKKRENRVCLD